MRIYLRFCCALMFGAAQLASARPVSYPGGWTVMQTNNRFAHGLHLHYSPTAKYSIGYKGEYWRDKQWQFQGAQLNILLKRWNQKGSQANIYFKNGLGIGHSDYPSFEGRTCAAMFSALAADWESRRFFTSYAARMTHANDIETFWMQQARIGIAPYIGDYGDIHTWLMLRLDQTSMNADQLVLTPMLRFFKAQYLVEIGVSHRGDFLFNWIIRF